MRLVTKAVLDGWTGAARRRGRWARVAPLAVLLLTGLALPGEAGASFTATSTNATDSVASAAVFPPFPTLVGQDAPTLYHPGEDAASATATPAVADLAAGNHPGTLNGASNGPTTWWRFNGDTTFAADSSGAVDSGAPKGTAALTAGSGRTGGRVLLDGSAGGYVEGAAGALDTSKSFTAAVWVDLAATGGDYAALAVEGSAQSGFGLMFRNSCTCWELRTTTADTTSSAVSSTQSAAGSAVAGTWTHLAVVYDASTSTRTFYVNGSPQNALGTSTTWTGWKAAGNLVAGRQTGGGNPVNYWKGGLDEVLTYQRALSAADVSALSAGVPGLQWGFDEEKGSTTRDLSGNGAAGTFGSGASPNFAGRSSGAVKLDGTANGYVSTGTNPVDTAGSFTVSALVKLNSSTAATTVLSQKGITGSGFVLKYDDVGGGVYRWVFAMARTDSANPTVDQTSSTTAVTANTWYHLTAVHDAGAQTLTLYVNGSAVGTPATHPGTVATTGGLQLGRAWSSGAWAGTFSGYTDQVSAYPRALTAAQVATLAADPARSTAAVPGALTGVDQGLAARTAIAYQGVEGGYNGFAVLNPTTFTIEAWFRTTTTTGGQVLGLSSSQTAMSGMNSDRMVFMTDDGRLSFVVAGTPTTQLTSPAGRSYNDGGWHHVAATFTAAPAAGIPAMKLYADGDLVVSSTAGAAITPTSYTGYWRWGGAQVSGWATSPTTNAFLGSIDEVCVYPTVLSAQRVAEHAYSNF